MTDPAAALEPASLRGLTEAALDETLRAFANAHGADALPALTRLADGFERYAGALDYTRRVYFIDHPAHPFFQLRFG